jgi:CHAT domain-containing protein
LWDVDDRSSAEFMSAFYRHLLKSGEKAIALREAMREVRSAHPHPFYWAPFFLIGKALH